MKRFGINTVRIKVTTSDGKTYVGQSEFTDELLDSAEDIVADEADAIFRETLNKAFDGNRFYRSKEDLQSYSEFERELIWEKVKNINTDEELEEIRQILRVEE